MQCPSSRARKTRLIGGEPANALLGLNFRHARLLRAFHAASREFEDALRFAKYIKATSALKAAIQRANACPCLAASTRIGRLHEAAPEAIVTVRIDAGGDCAALLKAVDESKAYFLVKTKLTPNLVSAVLWKAAAWKTLVSRRVRSSDEAGRRDRVRAQ